MLEDPGRLDSAVPAQEFVGVEWPNQLDAGREGTLRHRNWQGQGGRSGARRRPDVLARGVTRGTSYLLAGLWSLGRAMMAAKGNSSLYCPELS